MLSTRNGNGNGKWWGFRTHQFFYVSDEFQTFMFILLNFIDSACNKWKISTHWGTPNSGERTSFSFYSKRQQQNYFMANGTQKKYWELPDTKAKLILMCRRTWLIFWKVETPINTPPPCFSLIPIHYNHIYYLYMLQMYQRFGKSFNPNNKHIFLRFCSKILLQFAFLATKSAQPKPTKFIGRKKSWTQLEIYNNFSY